MSGESIKDEVLWIDKDFMMGACSEMQKMKNLMQQQTKMLAPSKA